MKEEGEEREEEGRGRGGEGGWGEGLVRSFLSHLTNHPAIKKKHVKGWDCTHPRATASG